MHFIGIAMSQQRLFFLPVDETRYCFSCGSCYNNLTLAVWPKPNSSVLRGNSYYLNAVSPVIHFRAIKEH